MNLLIWLIIFKLSILEFNCNEFKLSDSKVLIPRTSFISMNYTIKGSSSICHEWLSGTPEVVTVTPLYDPQSVHSKCSHESIITSVWQSNARATATIYAKNIATGHVVKCDVIVDNIHRLTIETRTLELYLHETPEALIAKAFDEYGNTFSTLDGVPFEWSVHAAGASADGQNVLRLITWTESEYITPILIGALEQQGLQGYMQLVSGLKTGAARISLVFRDDKLKTMVTSTEVRLLVMANAALSPPLAYIIPHTQLSYKILVHSQGSSQEVKMPNSQYFLKINNSDLAELDEKGSTVTAKKFGQTEVILIDRNINEDFRHPSSILYVVEPGFLSFHLSPGENQWVLQTGNIYIITVRPFDFNSHPIFMSDNMRLETDIPKEYFDIIFSSKNGTYNLVKAIKDGFTTLKSNFSFILLKNGTKLKLDIPVAGSQELVIYPPITVIPESIVIPWYPNELLVPGYLFMATGGSGEYKWMVSDSISLNEDRKSNNHSVSVDLYGHVKPLKLGVSYIIAADQRNIINRCTSKVTVDTIRSISFLLNKVEVEVNNELDLPLKAINSKNQTMLHCHWLPFEFSIGDLTKIEIVEVISSHKSNISEACALLKIRGNTPGFSKITASLVKLLTSKSTKDFLTTSITIGTFRPTRFIDPFNGFSTIGVLSMQSFNIVDGPLPWTLDPSKYFYELKETDQSKRAIKKISLGELEMNSKFTGLLLQIQCIEIGEVELAVMIGNRPSMKNPQPTTSIGSIKMSCTLPVFMKLIPKLLQMNVSLDCPFENDTDTGRRITVNNKKPLLIEVSFTDRNGYQLDRSESFNINVEISSLITTQNILNIVEQVRPKVMYTAEDKEYGISPTKSYFYISPNKPGLHIGDIQVKAVSNSYRVGKGPSFHLESNLNVRISKSMIVEPAKLTLYQHEQISGKISVTHGSGHFIVLPPSPDFLKVNLIQTSLDNVEGNVYEVLQTKVDKSQRNGVIQILDTCFNSVESESENSKSVFVELVRPFRLQLLSLNKIQLGSQITVLLQVFDDTDRIFPSEYLNMLDFDLLVNDNFNIISPHSASSKEWVVAPCEYSKSVGLIFRLTGEKVGFTSFSVSLKQNKEIVSNVQKVEVFPPLKLSPKHTVLLEGTELQLRGIGGPQCCHDMLHFSIIKNSTLGYKEAKIEFIKGPNGLIKGVVHGAYAVTVRIEISDVDPSNGNRLTVLSKDDGLVGVVQIKSMSIHSPTNRLIAGNSMPLWITFSSTLNDLEHLPITGVSLAGELKEKISFKWNLNPPQGVIANLEHCLEPAGIHIESKYLHSGMRLNSLNPGNQKIEVSVSGLPYNWLSKDINKFEPLVSILNIALISRLEVLEPSIAVRTLMLPPSTRITLKSTLDNEAVVTYSISHHNEGSVAVPHKSMINSGNILETSDFITSNEEEQFVLHIRSSHPIKHNNVHQVVGNQSLAILVTVKYPTYSMLSPFIYGNSIFQKFQSSKDSNYDSEITFLPLGGPFVFRITNHDELGNIFDVSPDSNTISYSVHRSDNLAISIVTEEQSKLSYSPEISKIENVKISKFVNTDFLSSEKLFQLQGLASGDNVLQLFYRDSISETNQLTDIVSIPTKSALHCKNYQESIYVEGLKVKYMAPFESGFWYSSDPDIVTIGNISGDAILKKQGTSNIFYGLTNIKKGQMNKNVLISNELTVLPASLLSLKVVESFLPPDNDSCSKKECIPINFNYQSNSLVAALYIYSNSMKYEINENSKFEKESVDNMSHKTSEEVPIECNADFMFGENSVFRNDLFSSLINIKLLSIKPEYDSKLGIRQWVCSVTPKLIDSLLIEDLISFLQTIKSDLRLRLRARLRHSDIKSESVSVPIVLGYVLKMSNESQTMLNVVTSGEVLSDLKIVLAPATKHFLDENKKFPLLVVSNKPHILEVLTPRQGDRESGIWIYPLKAAVVNKETTDKVEITISFPLTKQMDKISVNIKIIGKFITEKQLKETGSQSATLSHVNWIRPVLCVIITGIIAVMVVMLVNNFIRPTLDNEMLSSPIKDANILNFPNAMPYIPFGGGASTRLTQHIWNSQALKKDLSPNYQDYGNPKGRFNNNLLRL